MPISTTGTPLSGVGVGVLIFQPGPHPLVSIVGVLIFQPGPHPLVSIVGVGFGIGLSVGVGAVTWSMATGFGVGVFVGSSTRTGEGVGVSLAPSTRTCTSIRSTPPLPSSAHNLRSRVCLPAGNVFDVHTWPVIVFRMK